MNRSADSSNTWSTTTLLRLLGPFLVWFALAIDRHLQDPFPILALGRRVRWRSFNIPDLSIDDYGDTRRRIWERSISVPLTLRPLGVVQHNRVVPHIGVDRKSVM